LTQGRVIPALVTPAAAESTLKLRFRRDALPLQTVCGFVLLRAFAAFYLMHFTWGKQPQKLKGGHRARRESKSSKNTELRTAVPVVELVEEQ